MPEWLIVATKEYLFVKETSSSIVMGTVTSLFDSGWVQLHKFSFLTGWSHWLENRKSWIIKTGVEFIIQVSLVHSQRRLHDGQNHLFCDVKMSGFKNWYIEVWMFAETGRVAVSRFSSDTDEQKQVLQETVFFVCYKLDGLLLLIYLLAHLKQLAVFPLHLAGY